MNSRRFGTGLIFLSIVCAAAPLLGAQAESHPFSIHDMLAMHRLSAPEVSPDGKQVVFAVSTPDLEANRNRTDLWILQVETKGVRRLTTHPASEFNPRWSPDGASIFFLSSRSGSVQVWQIPVGGGEAVQLSNLPLDVGSLSVSPDGSWLGISMEVYPDCPELACSAKRLEENNKRPASGRAFDALLVRHWDTWADGRRSHVFVMPTSGGEARDLMPGMVADSPSKPFGGPEEFSFTPDSKGVVFTARQGGTPEAWSTNFDLYYAPVNGSAPPRVLTSGNPAWDTQPVFSPDGRTLAYLAMRRPGFEADRFRIVLRSWPDGPERTVTEQWDRSPSSMVWAADGKTLFVTAPHLGQQSLFAVDAASGTVRDVLREGYISAVSPLGQDALLILKDDLRNPAELFRVHPDGTRLESLTEVNRDKVNLARMGEPEQFSFAGWNGETVYAWVVKPVDFKPDSKYPVAFLIHGGPQGSFGNHFHYRWNPQAYAGAGYAAVMVDFHGSTGYGQDFTDSISGDWGGKPLEDLQKGLAEALRRYPWMDGERVGALGASYGGFMINWIAGNWPTRFRCLVNHDGIFDQEMMYYVTEELWFPEWEMGGPYWQRTEAFEKHNPARFVANWQTPTLVVHGALDFRVPLEQGLATFTALQRRGVPSRFLYFPDENHWVLKPVNSVQWHEEVIGWLDRWLKK